MFFVFFGRCSFSGIYSECLSYFFGRCPGWGILSFSVVFHLSRLEAFLYSEAIQGHHKARVCAGLRLALACAACVMPGDDDQSYAREAGLQANCQHAMGKTRIVVIGVARIQGKCHNTRASTRVQTCIVVTHCRGLREHSDIVTKQVTDRKDILGVLFLKMTVSFSR